MFWIFRRTGAANFFNSLNNSCTLRANNNNNNDKNTKRPPRKAYGRLSVDSDDAYSAKNQVDDPYKEIGNFNLITSSDQNQNIVNEDSDMELNDTSKNSVQQKEFNANTINRLQTIVMSEDEDFDESLTCNVCDRAFHCHRQLASHQQKKRHFGALEYLKEGGENNQVVLFKYRCSGCDSLFPSLMLLEHHKEEFEHWSEDEDNRRPCCRRNRGDDFTDTDSITSEAESEDLERLL